jgi:hypothetical protein
MYETTFFKKIFSEIWKEGIDHLRLLVGNKRNCISHFGI